MSQATLLDGIVVLDATQVMAGPYCAMLLADMGARVIKVEPPAGDSTRSMAGARGNDSPAFNAVNRGKQGIVLDLNHEKGRAVFKRLARLSDILVENYRPGVMAKLGLDYESLRAENPRLIYASISGHGQTGPWASKGGFDLIAQGLSGVMSVTGTADGEPVKAGVPLTDLGAGLFALIGILARAAPPIDSPGRVSTSTRRSSMPASPCRYGKSPMYFATGTGAAAAWLGASHDGAVPGLQVRRRLHHDRRRQRSQLRQAGARARPPRVDRPTRASSPIISASRIAMSWPA